MIKDLFSLLLSLPQTAQIAIIASFFTIAGAFITAVFTIIGITIKNAHDSKQKRIEREMLLRRSVYLDAAEAISARIDSLYNMANLDKSHDEIMAAYRNKEGAISKIHLVAHENTIRALNELTSVLMIAEIALNEHRNQILQKKEKSNNLSAQIQSDSKERDSMMQIMKQLSFEGNADKQRWGLADNIFKATSNRIRNLINERQKNEIELILEWSHFAEKCFTEGKKVSLLVPPLVEAVRAELKLPFDFPEYKATYESNVEKGYILRKEYLNRLRSQYENLKNSEAQKKGASEQQNVKEAGP